MDSCTVDIPTSLRLDTS